MNIYSKTSNNLSNNDNKNINYAVGNDEEILPTYEELMLLKLRVGNNKNHPDYYKLYYPENTPQHLCKVRIIRQESIELESTSYIDIDGKLLEEKPFDE